VYILEDKLSKMLRKCGMYKKQVVFYFVCCAIYGMTGSHLRGHTLRVMVI
jgi:hypothetical protein